MPKETIEDVTKYARIHKQVDADGDFLCFTDSFKARYQELLTKEKKHDQLEQTGINFAEFAQDEDHVRCKVIDAVVTVDQCLECFKERKYQKMGVCFCVRPR